MIDVRGPSLFLVWLALIDDYSYYLLVFVVL